MLILVLIIKTESSKYLLTEGKASGPDKADDLS